MSETRAEMVAGRIRASIEEGKYLSGERLVELTLSKGMNVSQNTIRDALHLLEREGWVVKNPRHGVYVRAFSPDEIDEVFALLGAIESLALTWAMAAMTKPTLTELKGYVENARRCANQSQRADSIEALFQFHQGIGRCAAKSFTIGLLDQLYNHARLLERLRQARAPRNPVELDAHVARHEVIIRHIGLNDTETARRLLGEQIAEYARLTQEALSI